MPEQLKPAKLTQRRYALCVGIGSYTNLSNHNLRYAVQDALAIANKLQDQHRGQFEVSSLTESAQTTKLCLEEAFDSLLNGPHLNPHDVVVIYISCHGNVFGKNHTFYLLPSDAVVEEDGMPKKTSVIDIHDVAKMLTGAKVKNIIFLLDACHSGGIGGAFQYINLERDLTPDTTLFMVGAARHDQVAHQSSHAKHGVFTHCLLRAFEQRPRRKDGWLTFSEIYTFLSEDIKHFESEDVLQFQSVVAAVDPNIPFCKNPQYSPHNREFAQKVRKLLQLVQYQSVEIDIPEKAPANFSIAEIKSGLRTSRVGIIPYYNAIEPLPLEYVEYVTSFVKAQVEEGILDYGLLITMIGVNSVIEQKVGNRFLEILTYADIWKNLIDFKKYLRKLVRDYETSPQQKEGISLAKVYVPLNVEYRRYEAEDQSASQLELDILDNSRKRVKTEIGRGYEVLWQGDAQVVVRRWLADPTSTRLALLADYGSGKTSFCQHLATTLAKEHLEAANSQQHAHRFPLLIPLLDFARVPIDLESYLIAYLKRRCGVDNPDFDALMKMAEAGYLLFILDGFDEMASRANDDTIRQNIALFEELAKLEKNKVLLTTRPEYFTTHGNEREVLRSYPCLHLQLFDNDQVDLYLQKRVPLIEHHESQPSRNWEYYRQQIDTIHDLTDLVRRPVLLEMIIKTLPTLIAQDKVINRPNLYQSYLEGELDRQLIQKQRRDLQIHSKKRFEIMEQIALELYRTGKAELTSKRISEVSRNLLSVAEQEELDGSLREIVTCSFLIRRGEGRYRFSHQSFLEYLVACYLAKEISLAKEVIPARGTNSLGLSNYAENGYEMSRSPSRYLEIFRQRPVSRTIQDFLIEMEIDVIRRNKVNTVAYFDHMNLVHWFIKYPTDKPGSANAISLLAKLLPHDRLCQLPFKNADLSGADLSGIDLHGIDFRGANLSDADLTYANLRLANLSRANLRDANLGNAVLVGALLNDTDLQGVNLSNANLGNAKLNSANLQYADIRGANFMNAELVGADLRRVEMHSANFSAANITGSKRDVILRS